MNKDIGCHGLWVQWSTRQEPAVGFWNCTGNCVVSVCFWVKTYMGPEEIVSEIGTRGRGKVDEIQLWAIIASPFGCFSSISSLFCSCHWELPNQFGRTAKVIGESWFFRLILAISHSLRDLKLCAHQFGRVRLYLLRLEEISEFVLPSKWQKS